MAGGQTASLANSLWKVLSSQIMWHIFISPKTGWITKCRTKRVFTEWDIGEHGGISLVINDIMSWLKCVHPKINSIVLNIGQCKTMASLHE